RLRQHANGLLLPRREHDAAVSIDHKLSKPSAYRAGQAERARSVEKQHQALADAIARAARPQPSPLAETQDFAVPSPAVAILRRTRDLHAGQIILRGHAHRFNLENSADEDRAGALCDSAEIDRSCADGYRRS